MFPSRMAARAVRVKPQPGGYLAIVGSRQKSPFSFLASKPPTSLSRKARWQWRSFAFTTIRPSKALDNQFVGLQPGLLSWHQPAGHAAAGSSVCANRQRIGEQMSKLSGCHASAQRSWQGKAREAWPNHSLKLSANGVSRWPSSAGPAAHFALAVQRATPLSPA